MATKFEVGDIAEGSFSSPVIFGPEVRFRGEVRELAASGELLIVKILKPFDECTCYVSRIVARAAECTKSTDEAMNRRLREALAKEP